MRLEAQTITIGRGSDCDVRLDDNLASRQHAQLTCGASDAVYCLNDLGSTNGTFVNGVVVEDPIALQDGDKIRVGRHVFKFAMLDEFESEFQLKIQQMIIRDDLTNLLTQRSFFNEFERLLARRRESPEPGNVALLMMDLDHFKLVNDTYGHLVGSQAIKKVGELIRAQTRDSDLTARYGGEEFIACLSDATVDRARLVAERIREAIASHRISVTRKSGTVTLSVTISIGFSCFPSDSDEAIELIELADLALYRAKTEGRNRVCAFDRAVDHFDARGYQRLDLRSLLEGSGSLS